MRQKKPIKRRVTAYLSYDLYVYIKDSADRAGRSINKELVHVLESSRIMDIVSDEDY